MHPLQNRVLRIAGPLIVVAAVGVLIGAGLAFAFPQHHAAARGGAAVASAVPAAEMANPDVNPGTWFDLPAPGFTLVDQRNRPVSLAQFRGKVVVLAFIDSHCTTICPLTTQSMVNAMHLLGPAARNVTLVGIDANPEKTKVSDVEAYTVAHGMQGRWEFLTGSLSQLKQVWRDYHVYVAAVHNDIDHSPVFYLIGPDGRERVIYDSQMSYEGVDQQAQIVANGIARLLPGHPAVAQRVALGFVRPLKPTAAVALKATGGDPVFLGPGHPHLTMFFADWLDEDTNVVPKLDGLGRYARTARQHGWPAPVVVNEVTTEPDGARDASLARFASSAHVPVVDDASGRLADGYGVLDLPWYVLTSASGRVIWQHDGWLSGAELVHDAGAALAAKRSS